MSRDNYIIMTQDRGGYISDSTAKGNKFFDTALTKRRYEALVSGGGQVIDSLEVKPSVLDSHFYVGHREVLESGLPFCTRIFRNIIEEDLGGDEMAIDIPPEFKLAYRWTDHDEVSNMDVTFETWALNLSSYENEPIKPTITLSSKNEAGEDLVAQGD